MFKHLVVLYLVASAYCSRLTEVCNKLTHDEVLPDKLKAEFENYLDSVQNTFWIAILIIWVIIILSTPYLVSLIAPSISAPAIAVSIAIIACLLLSCLFPEQVDGTNYIENGRYFVDFMIYHHDMRYEDSYTIGNMTIIGAFWYDKLYGPAIIIENGTLLFNGTINCVLRCKLEGEFY